MSEEQKIVTIDEVSYLVDDIGESCIKLLNESTQMSNIANSFAIMVQATMTVADMKGKEGKKLLPEPYQAEEAEPEEDTSH